MVRGDEDTSGWMAGEKRQWRSSNNIRLPTSEIQSHIHSASSSVGCLHVGVGLDGNRCLNPNFYCSVDHTRLGETPSSCNSCSPAHCTVQKVHQGL